MSSNQIGTQIFGALFAFGAGKLGVAAILTASRLGIFGEFVNRVRDLSGGEGPAVDGVAREDLGLSLNAIEQVIRVRPDMIDAWMELQLLVREARDDNSMDSVREQLDDALARLLSGAEQIRSCAHRFRDL